MRVMLPARHPPGRAEAPFTLPGQPDRLWCCGPFRPSPGQSSLLGAGELRVLGGHPGLEQGALCQGSASTVPHGAPVRQPQSSQGPAFLLCTSW